MGEVDKEGEGDKEIVGKEIRRSGKGHGNGEGDMERWETDKTRKADNKRKEEVDHKLGGE